MPIEFFRGMKQRPDYFRGSGYIKLKRALDVCGSTLLLVALSPVLIVLSATVLVLDGRPILFLQLRPGRDGKPFVLYKFRTMRPKVAAQTSTEISRVTKLGKILRKTSLDELPSLLNVLRGEMSLVGPRPLLTGYLPIYIARHQLRHDVRPGITGLAQVSGRNRLTWFERLELDVSYVSSISFYLDVKILLKTITTVISGNGVTSADGNTMQELAHGYESLRH